MFFKSNPNFKGVFFKIRPNFGCVKKQESMGKKLYPDKTKSTGKNYNFSFTITDTYD